MLCAGSSKQCFGEERRLRSLRIALLTRHLPCAPQRMLFGTDEHGRQRHPTRRKPDKQAYFAYFQRVSNAANNCALEGQAQLFGLGIEFMSRFLTAKEFGSGPISAEVTCVIRGAADVQLFAHLSPQGMLGAESGEHGHSRRCCARQAHR